VAAALDAGIPVIVLDRPVIGDKYTCFITADDHQIASAAGRWLAERMGGKGRVIELKGPDDAGPGHERHRGFRAAVRDYPDLRVLHEYPTTADPASAGKAMASALSDFGEIDAVFAYTDAAAHAAYLTAQESGRADEMLWVAIGALPDEGIAYVEQGMLTATFEYPTGAREAIATALDVLAGKEVPKHLTLTPRVFTQANLPQGGEPIDEARPSSGKRP
jgi:ribose transport system substrate-binding protein